MFCVMNLAFISCWAIFGEILAVVCVFVTVFSAGFETVAVDVIAVVGRVDDTMSFDWFDTVTTPGCDMVNWVTVACVVGDAN